MDTIATTQPTPLRDRIAQVIATEGHPLYADEFTAATTTLPDGSIKVRLFGTESQTQAVEFLAEHEPTLRVDRFGLDSIVVSEVSEDVKA